MPKSMTPADFNRLTDAEQREVAARLLRLSESGWKPFWCPEPDCDGFPHWETDEEGEAQFVAATDALAGPAGQPLGRVVYAGPEGLWEYDPDDEDCPVPGPDDEYLGRAVLEPRWAHKHARADQRLPPWAEPWTLFIMSGRGSGKTTTGTEFVTLSARRGLDGAIVGRRGTELVNTHVATIIARAHPDFVPTYWASKDLLEWPEVVMADGTKRKPVTYLFSAEKPENIRSVNLSYVWFDEAAFMDEVEVAWMNAKLATRIEFPNNPIHKLITSTPTATPWVMKMEDDETVEIRRVSTYANRSNLSKDYLAELKREYEGTRMGRQELHGEVLRDVEGALWNDDLFRHISDVDEQQFVNWIESMESRVVAVDPAGSKGPRSDSTGIIGAGMQSLDEEGEFLETSRFYVLADATLKGTPTEWARQTFKVARLIRADKIVAEKNFGGDMVAQVLGDFAAKYPTEACDDEAEPFLVEVLHAVKSKETRAEGTVARYEQGRVFHLLSSTAFGDLSMLEKEQVGWVPKSRGGKFPSPNRIDALVWAVRELDKTIRYVAQTASSKGLAAKIRGTGSRAGMAMGSRRNPMAGAVRKSA